MSFAVGTKFGPGWGVEVLLTKDGGVSALPGTLKAYMTSTPLQNGKYIRTLYVPQLTDSAVSLTATLTQYKMPKEVLMGKDNILPGSTGDVVPIVLQSSTGQITVNPNTDFAFLDKECVLNIRTSVSTNAIENFSVSNYYIE